MSAVAERVFNFLEEEEETDIEDDSSLPELITRAVDFDHVSFGVTRKRFIQELVQLLKHPDFILILQGQKIWKYLQY